MSNDQSYLDNGTTRAVRIVGFDAEGCMSDEVVIAGQASTYAAAVELAKEAGYVVIDDPMYAVGHVASFDGPDAYGIPVRSEEQ